MIPRHSTPFHVEFHGQKARKPARLSHSTPFHGQTPLMRARTNDFFTANKSKQFSSTHEARPWNGVEWLNHATYSLITPWNSTWNGVENKLTPVENTHKRTKKAGL
jgi:hypothetical protein